MQKFLISLEDSVAKFNTGHKIHTIPISDVATASKVEDLLKEVFEMGIFEGERALRKQILKSLYKRGFDR